MKSMMELFDEGAGVGHLIDCEHRVASAMWAGLGARIATKDESMDVMEKVFALARWWEWEKVRVGVGKGYPSEFFEVIQSIELVPEILQYLPKSSSEAKAMYLKWMKAFACDKCKQPGAARRQCAMCASFLCLSCSERCARDNRKTCRKFIDTPEGEWFGEGSATSICGFAICKNCHALNSLIFYKDATFDKLCEMHSCATPSLSANLCKLRPPYQQELMCHAHLNWDIVECSYCEEDRRCLKHSARLTPSLPTKRFHETLLRCRICRKYQTCGGPNCPGDDSVVFRRCSSEDCAWGHGLYCTTCKSGPTCECGLDLVVV